MTVLSPHQHQFLSGHANLIKRLKKSYDTNQLHHAIILVGLEGVGKETLAYQFIRYALAYADQKPEQENLFIPEAHRVNTQVFAESHPHIFKIQPVYDEKKQRYKRDITLDALKGLSNFLRLSPPADARRFIIVNPADGMNKNTQNALLKLLEEPPAATHFLLLTERLGALLPTIRSRCLTLHLDALSEAEFTHAMQRLVPSMDDTRINMLYALSEGIIGKALEIEESILLEAYASICAAIIEWHDDTDSLAAMRLAESLSRPGQEDLVAKLVETVLARLALFIKLKLLENDSLQSIIPEELRLHQIWAGISLSKCLNLYDRCTESWQAADTGHLDKKLALLQLMRLLTGMDR